MSTQYTIFSIKKKKKITLNYPKSAAVGFFLGKAMVNEPTVFEPLKFYCILHCALRYNNTQTC